MTASTERSPAGARLASAQESDRPAGREPVVRAFEAVAYLAGRANAQIGVRELARHLDISPATSQQIISTLSQCDVLERATDGSGYSFSPSFVRLARRIAASSIHNEVVRKALHNLALVSGETALFGEYDHRLARLMFTDMAESSYAVRYVARLHEWLPVHRGASGLVVMAELHKSDLDRVLKDAAADTSNGYHRMKGAVLSKELEKIRDQGYAITHGDRVPGAVGIFSPVLDGDGLIFGVVGLNIPEQR